MFGRVLRRAGRQRQPPPALRTRLQVEILEDRWVLDSLTLTPLVGVSGPSPFLDCPLVVNDPFFGQSTEVEPYVAVNPTNPNHLVGAWIQDFARGIVAGVSFNGGNTWQSVVIPQTVQCDGGVWPHASDPWISFAPNGDVYLSLIGFSGFPFFGKPNAILVSKSTDGGLTWGAPTTIVAGEKDYHDKESITADPTDAQYVYAAWTKFHNNTGIPMFSRTTDGGQTWEPAREIFQPGGNNVIEGFQIVVLPDGTLVNIFTQQIHKYAAGGVRHYDLEISLLRSSDRGETWQAAPTPVAAILPLGDTISFDGFRGVPNPDGGLGIRAPYYFFDVAVDPASGNVYAVWQDVRFSDFQHASIAFSMSTDGGLTWSAPIQVNQTPQNIPAGNQQAFLPSVAVNADGVVAVTYYDVRNNTPAAGLPTDYWMVHAHPSDGLTNPASWSQENRLTPASFNMENAPAPDGYFIGDYEGLVAQGRSFGAFFTMPSGSDLSSVFYRDPLPAEEIAAPIPALPGIDIRGADLSGALLGGASTNTSWLDDNAAGWGWFVDPRPSHDSEFTTPGDPLTLPSPQSGRGDAWDKMDLLTALAHEIGHLLGQDHADDGVMAETLMAGTRRMPLASTDADWLAAVDVLFSKKSRN